jgi:uncharacterized membrane protein YbhN (UPF0104 family)
MKNKAFLILKIAVVGITFYFIFTQIQIDELLRLWYNIDLIFLPLCLLAMLMVMLLLAKRLTYIGNLVIPQKIGFMSKVFFFNNLLPAQVGGDIFKYTYLRQSVDSDYEIGATIISDRFTGLLTLNILVLTILVLASAFFIETSIYYSSLLFIALLTTATMVFLFLPLGWVKQWRWIATYVEKADKLRRQIVVTVRTKFIGGFAYSLLAFLALILVNIFAMYAVAEKISVLSSLIYIPVITIAVIAMPVSLNGLGIRESLFIVFFTMRGFTAEEALGMASINYFVILFFSITGGILILLERIKNPNSKAANEDTI